MRIPRHAARIGAASAGLALGLILAEIGCRLFLGTEELPQKARFHRSLTYIDAELLYRLRPNVQADWADATGRAIASVPFTTNAHGRRATEFQCSGVGEELLVACLGDSTTMGFGVGDEEHFPFLVGELLAESDPGRPIRVLNYGTHGYTSRQGLKLLESHVLPQSPDVVVIAFGYNDAYLSSRDEDSWHARLPGKRWEFFHNLLNPHSEVYRRLWDGLYPQRHRSAPVPRTGRRRFEINIRRMVQLVTARDARAVVIDSNIPNNYLRTVTRRIAIEEGAAYLCAVELFERAARERGLQPEAIALNSSPDVREVEIRWRGDRPVLLILIDLADECRVPMAVPMLDDGTRGDEVAGDGIATLVAPLPEGDAEFEFCIIDRELLEENPEEAAYQLYRRIQLAAGEGYISEVWTPDSWRRGIAEFVRARASDYGHPNARGHRILATALHAAMMAQ